MRRHARATLGPAVLGLVLALSACSGPSGSDGTGGSGGTGAGVDLGSVAAVRAEAQRVVERFAGTPSQVDALGVLDAYRDNGATAQCLFDRGFPGWDWARFARSDPGLDALAGSPPWSAAPHRPVWSLRALASPRRGRAAPPAADSPLHGPAFQAALTACVGSSTSDLGVTSIKAPAAVPRLERAWQQTLVTATSPIGTEEQYAACMTRRRIPLLAGRPYSPSRAEQAMATLYPPVRQLPVAGRPTSAAWQRFLAGQQQLTDADWACRSRYYEAAVLAVGPPLIRFEADHADDLDQAAAYWTAVSTRAEQLGWSPRTGTVDTSRRPG